MHIRVNRQNFLSAMRVVEKAIKENKIKPVLSCVYLKVKDNKLNFCGTNLESTIKTFIDIEEVIAAGEIAFHYSIIDEYLKEIKDEIITLRVEEGNILFIETEDSTTEFSVFSTEDYPNSFDEIILNENNLKFEMPSNELIEVFEKIIFAADSPDNIAMNCIKIESILKHLHFVATNTYRLAFLKKPISTNLENFSVSVPADAISSIIKILKTAEADTVRVYQEYSHLYFVYKNIIIVTKLIELRFPDYIKILTNSNYDKKMTIGVEKFTNILKRVSIFSRSNFESKYATTYKFENNKMTVSALNDIAKINEEIAVDFAGEELKISLNVKFLLEFIQNIPKEKEIELEFMYSNSSVKVYEKDRDDYLYILMPLALRD